VAKHEGLCRLCLSEGPLSKEHVPPAAAGNSGRMTVRPALDFLRDPSTEAGRIFQNGSWTYSLCGRCNSFLGRHYVPEYVRWAKLFLNEHRLWYRGMVPAYVRTAFPLRFFKQALAMIFSVNGDEFAHGFHRIAQWILDPAARGWDWHYRLYLTLAVGDVGRGWNILFRGGDDPGMFTEVAFSPFSVQLYLDEQQPERPGDITWFARCGYDQREDLSLALPCGFLASALPGEFASPEEVAKAVAAGKAHTEPSE
jgi:hypothetical protein